MVSDMLRIDITDNIHSISHCNGNTYNPAFGISSSLSNNITVYLPRIDGYARNKPSLKSKTFSLVCRRYKIEKLLFYF